MWTPYKMGYEKQAYQDFAFCEIIEIIKMWTWKELQYALSTKMISREDVLKYAKCIIDENMGNYQELINLIIIGENDDIGKPLVTLANLEPEESIEEILKKWAFAMIYSLVRKRKQYTDFYVQLDLLIADFYQPKELNGLRYNFPKSELDEVSWGIESEITKYLKRECNRYNVPYTL